MHCAPVLTMNSSHCVDKVGVIGVMADASGHA